MLKHPLCSALSLCATAGALQLQRTTVFGPISSTTRPGKSPSLVRLGCETIQTDSSSDASVDSVVRFIEELYPPQLLDQRIALSRKDGYWPYISAGEDPPKEFVYGEFDVSFLHESLERALELRKKQDVDKNSEESLVFCDLGSGTGRLVLAAAALYPNWKVCRGIELLESIHEEAVEKVQSCRQHGSVEDEIQREEISNGEEIEVEGDSNLDIASSETHNTGTKDSSASNETEEEDGDRPFPKLAPIELECGSFSDPYGSMFDADIIFCFSSCLPDHARIELARSIGRQCLPGTIVLTTEYKLPSGGVLDPVPDDPDYPTGSYEFEHLETLSGDCDAVGGVSTVYLQKLVRSVGTGARRVPPELPVSEIAYRAVRHAEDKNDSTVFLRQVSNQMAFLGFPESWRPKC